MTDSRLQILWFTILVTLAVVYLAFVIMGSCFGSDEEASFSIPEWRLRFTFYWKWFDLWIGAYIPRRDTIYLQPLFCVGVKITILPKSKP